MSQPESSEKEFELRWTAGSLALFVIGLEILALSSLFAGRILFGFMGRGAVTLLPYGGMAIAAGVGLAVSGLLMRPRETKVPWTAVSVALFVLGILILVPSGLCTGLGGYYALSVADVEQPLSRRAVESAFIMAQVTRQVLIVGSVSIVIGSAFVVVGLKTRRRD